MRWPALLPLIALVILLPGCATDQAGDVAAYRSLTDITTEAPGHARGRELTLLDAVRLANAYNERLAIGGEAYVQALADRQRLAASLLPTLDLFGDLTLREHTGGGAGSTGGGSVARFDGGFSAQYTLLTGLTDFRTVRAADLDIEARRWLLLDLREVLILDTATAYYEVLRADRLIRVLESSMTVQNERLRDILARQRVGFARPLDVAQIEAQVSQTRVLLLNAENRLGNARAALKLLTAVDTDESVLTDGFEPGPVPDSVDPVVAGAERNRQDLMAARKTAEAARELVDASIGRYYPSIGVNLDYFLTRDTSPTDLDLSGLISINLPIFSAGRIEADVRRSWSVFRETVLNYSLTRRRIRLNVESAIADLSASQKRVDELRIQVTAAQEALRQAEAGYQTGLGTNLERVTAQDQLLAAQLQAASEDFTRKLSYLALLRACGTISTDVAGAAPVEIPDHTPVPESPFIRLAPADESQGESADAARPGG
ncbi:MAG: TolC family protein [Phycisphaerales bacterium]|nr:TolC family protein [Phycisphaerales bacterium]